MTKVFAHRGDTRHSPENSLAAFLAAVDAGAHGVELDVRRTADGALVVAHDPEIEGLGAVCEVAVRDLPGHVCLLEDALEVLSGLVVNVEIKNDPDEPGYDRTGSLAHEVVALLESRGDLDRVVISSFDLATADAARTAHPGVAVGWLLSGTDPLDAVPLAVAHGFNALHPFVLTVGPRAVDRAHDAGLEINTWTVNARHDLERMAALGVDAVITDDVGLALEALAVPARNGGSAPSSA